MHRLILLCLLLQIPWAYATTESATIYDHSAIQFLAHEKSDAWSQHEVATLQNFIETLPSALHPSSLIDDPSSPILVYKNHPAFASTHHSAAEPLNIQSDDSSSAAQTQQLLHYLLHRYEDINCASCSTEWREISGWRRGVLGLTYHAQNQDPRGYAAKAGLISPSEDFVTLAEHYLLPPTSTMEASIRCRTPQKYAYIKKQFADFQSPLERPEIACRKVDDGLLDDVVFYDPISHQPIEMGPINMETVKGFELLYATPGTGDASEIAGHLLLRIKLANNPQAELAGIENPHDLVISFLANTADTTANIPSNTAPEEKLQCKTNWLNIVDDGRNDFSAMHSIFQSLKGLSGGFLTMMNRQTLAEAIKSYTIEEERDLLRYELLLTKQQQYHLLQRLHLAKKNYNARYYFFNQNCASVLVTVIGQGINHQEIANFSPLVSPPNGLVGLFIRNGLARPVTPSIYSYRKRGFLAQEMIQSLYEDFPVATATDSRPAIEGLFSKRESTQGGSIPAC